MFQTLCFKEYQLLISLITIQFSTCATFSTLPTLIEDEIFYMRRMNKSNSHTFKMLISKNDWNAVMSKSTSGDAFDTFYAHIKSCYHEAFPLIKMKQNAQTRNAIK